MQVLVSISSSGPCIQVASLDFFLTFSYRVAGEHVWTDSMVNRGGLGG